MSSRLSVVPSALPGVVLLVALGGQLKEQLAVLALVGGGVTAVWGAGLSVALVVQVVRKGAFGGVLVGLAVCVVGALVADAPLWVQWRAAPAITAVERVRAETGRYPEVGSLEGDFPRDIRAILEASGHCLYKPRGTSYHLACLGVPFARCGYDGATGRWSGWE